MQYAKMTVEVVFEHGDDESAERVALGIAEHYIYRGPVISVRLDTDEIQPLNADQVIEAMGGCGECDACKANREDLAVHAVMEGSALAQTMGTAGLSAIVAEQAAVVRAQRTV